MAILLSVQDLEKSFAHRLLFKGISFGIESGDRVGLIGPNGAGKSTLLKILAGKESPDGGQVTRQKGLRIGYLQQVPQFDPQSTVESAIFADLPNSDDWQVQARAYEYMNRLGIDEDITKSVADLSGGWRKRVALARELARDPDLLLLDEPTNHLDVESIMWLEDFLASSRFATLTVTHDILFLQKVSNRILELDRRNANGILNIKGSYADYLEAKQDLMAAQEGHEQKLRNTLRRETEWLRRGAQARQTKQTARIKAAEDLKDQVDDLQRRNTNAKVDLEFLGYDRSPKKLIEAKGISKSYNGKIVIPEIDILISPKSRIGLLGANGCGKSTLIRLLLKQEPPDQGSVFHSDSLEVSYFEQNREVLDPAISVLRTICPLGDMVEFGGNHLHVRGYLGKFLFDPLQMDMPVGKLSGGEQSRLLLAKLMLTRANVLVLDEPTNDLDMQTLEVLREVLAEFRGAVILVSHDRYFLDQVSNQIFAFGINEKGEKTITPFADVAQWESSVRSTGRSVEAKSQAASTSTAPKKKRNRVVVQKELDDVMAEIEAGEKKLKDLQNASTQGLSPDQLRSLTTDMSNLQAKLEALYQKWEGLSQE